MSVSRDDIKKALGEMPVMELVELIKELEEDWEAVLLSEDGHDTIWDEFKHGVLEH
mgnify:CR=1 FL=1